MSLRRDLEEAKKGNIRYADQLAAAGGMYAGNKLTAAGGTRLAKAIQNEYSRGDGVTMKKTLKQPYAFRDNPSRSRVKPSARLKIIKGPKKSKLRAFEESVGLDEVTRGTTPAFQRAIDKVKKRDPSLGVDAGSLAVRKSLKDEFNKKYDPKIKGAKSNFMRAFYQMRKNVEEDIANRGGAHYSPGSHKIRLPSHQATEAILEHEAGHATKDFAKKFLQKGRAPMSLAGGVVALKSAISADKAYKGKGKKRSDDYRKARNEAALAAGLIGAPTLTEEARATGYAIKRMKGKRMRALKQLAPAYATYVGKLGVPVAAPVAALEYYRRKHSKGKK